MGKAVKAAKKPPEIPAALIDEFGDVVRLRDAFAPTERRYNQLRDKLKELVADADPEAELTPQGERYLIHISARSFERKPDIPAVRKRLGAEKFLQVCHVTLKALEGFLLKHEIEDLTVTTRTGSRSYVPGPIPPG